MKYREKITKLRKDILKNIYDPDNIYDFTPSINENSRYIVSRSASSISKNKLNLNDNIHLFDLKNDASLKEKIKNVITEKDYEKMRLKNEKFKKHLQKIMEWNKSVKKIISISFLKNLELNKKSYQRKLE